MAIYKSFALSNFDHCCIVWLLTSKKPLDRIGNTWWRHQMETSSALLAICAGNSPVPGEFPAQRPVTRSFDAFFDLALKKWLSKQSWGWWFETLSRSLWRHCNVSKHALRFVLNDYQSSYHGLLHQSSFTGVKVMVTAFNGNWGLQKKNTTFMMHLF